MTEPIVEEVFETIHGDSPIDPTIINFTDLNDINTYAQEHPYDCLMIVNDQDLANTQDEYCDVVIDKEVDLDNSMVKVSKYTVLQRQDFKSIRKYVYKRAINPEKDKALIECARMNKTYTPKVLHSEHNCAYKIEYPDNYDFKNDKEYHSIYAASEAPETFESNMPEYDSDYDSDEFSDFDDLMDIEAMGDDDIVEKFNEMRENFMFERPDLDDFS